MNIFNLFQNKQSTPQPIMQETNKETQPVEIKATKANKIFAQNVDTENTQQYINAYSKADVVFSCVSYIADIVSQLEFRVYSNKNGNLVHYKNQKVLEWFSQPNPFQPMSDVLHLYIQSYLLAGNAYLTFEKVGNKFEGWVLDPTKVEIVPHPKKYIDGFLFDGTLPYKTDEIIFFKNPTLSSEYYGASILKSLVDPLLIEGFAVDELKSFYQNSLIAQGILSSEYPLSEKQIESLRSQFRALYGQKGEARHGFILTPNNIKFQSIRINPKDGLLLEALDVSEERIYKVFRLSPALLGNPKKDVNGTELREYKKLFINNFVRPIMYRLARRLETFFRRVLKDPTFTIEVSYQNIPEVNTAVEEKIDAVKLAVSSGLMTYNEGRDRLGLDPIENGKYMNSLLSPSFLFGDTPLDLVSGERLFMDGQNIGSSNPDGGKPDGNNPPK